MRPCRSVTQRPASTVAQEPFASRHECHPQPSQPPPTEGLSTLALKPRKMGLIKKLLTAGIATLLITSSAWADRMQSPISSDITKTQHFRKYVYANSASVPVTVKVKVSGDNVKVNKSLPYSFVVPARNKTEAFQTSAKDPRTYYGDPTVEEEFVFGDFRLSRSNLPLVAPCARGKSLTVADVSSAGTVTFEAEKDSGVGCARQGLVVFTDKNAVWVGHNDGSISRYTGLGSVSVAPGTDVNVGQALGKAGEKGFSFELAVPTADLGYHAIPAAFQVGGAKRELSKGDTLKR